MFNFDQSKNDEILYYAVLFFCSNLMQNIKYINESLSSNVFSKCTDYLIQKCIYCLDVKCYNIDVLFLLFLIFDFNTS